MEPFQKFRLDNAPPNVQLPEGSCDSQIHVFGDSAVYPARPGIAYAPFADATIDAAIEMHRALGLSRGVVVQSTVHGVDHRILFDALARAGDAYRGVAIVNDQVSDDEIRRLHEAGVRGARFNFWKQLNIAPTHDEFRRSIARIRDYGWIAKIHAYREEWIELQSLMNEVDTPVVIDHLGHIDLKHAAGNPVMDVFSQLVRKGNWWMMVSNAHRSSDMDAGWDDVVDPLRKVIDAAPDRVIWSTDWPHVQYRKPMPTDTELVNLLCRAVPEVDLQKMILKDNPEQLFWSALS